VYGKVKELRDQLDLSQRHVLLLKGYVKDLEHSRTVLLHELEQVKIGQVSPAPTFPTMLPTKEVVKRKWAEGPQAVGTSKGYGPIKNFQENPNFPNKKGKNTGEEVLTNAQLMSQVRHLMGMVKNQSEDKMVINLD
jgi:hypothetical protein